MSHIFDALRRSESERNGAALPGLQSVTELLQRTEAQMQRESSTLFEESAKSGAPEEHRPASRQVHEAREAGTLTTEAPPVPENQWEVTRQFQGARTSLSALSRLVSVVDKDSPAAEAFRLAAVRLKQLQRQRPLRKLLVTGTVPEEGKTFSSANLACTLAAGGRQKVLLIDGDLRRPSMPKMFGLEPLHGIAEWLMGRQSLTASIYQLDTAGICILPAGDAPGNPLELLQTGKLPALLNDLSGWFDWIIVDSPPVLPLADTSIWVRLTDAILLVTRRGTTEKRKLQRGLEALDPAKLIGTLINFSSSPIERDYYYYRAGRRE